MRHHKILHMWSQTQLLRSPLTKLIRNSSHTVDHSDTARELIREDYTKLSCWFLLKILWRLDHGRMQQHARGAGAEESQRPDQQAAVEGKKKSVRENIASRHRYFG